MTGEGDSTGAADAQQLVEAPVALLHSERTSLRSIRSPTPHPGTSTQTIPSEGHLLEMVSKDRLCLRTMVVTYTDDAGRRRQFSQSAYTVKCYLPPGVKDVEVTFSAVGGRSIFKVDRDFPGMPWVQSASGQYELERFTYSACPWRVQYEVRGPSLHSYISHVETEQDMDLAKQMEILPLGGITMVQQPHSEWLLPPEVLFYEPSKQEIGQMQSRRIFLNTPLVEAELEALATLHERMEQSPEAELLQHLQIHELRLLQHCGYDAAKTCELMQAVAKERLKKLPIAEADVLEDLHRGFIYFHGRDRQCRPCLIIRVENMGELVRSKERAVRLMMYVMEYGIRHALVPGRVEGWTAILDIANAWKVVSPLALGSAIALSLAFTNILERLYCGRMASMQIVNMPSKVLGRMINNAIPASKKHKVHFLQDVQELVKVIEPSQLEARYSGTCPNLAPEETYPFRFFPCARGPDEPNPVAQQGEDLDAESSSSSSHTQVQAEAEACSQHVFATREFHMGSLWDDSSPNRHARWSPEAQRASLTPASASALSELLGQSVEPCCDLGQWKGLMSSARHNPDPAAPVIAV